MLTKQNETAQTALRHKFPSKEKWEALASDAAYPVPFLIPSWQECCVHFLPSTKKLDVFQFEKQGELCGLAFMMEEPYVCMKRVRFIGSGKLDYLGFACKKGNETEFFDSFFMYWQHRRNVILDLQQLPESFPVQYIIKSAERHGFQAHLLQQDICPVLLLPQTEEAYFKSLSQNQRKAFKRLQNKLQKNFSFSFHRAETKQDLDFILPHFFKLHRMRWLKRGLPGMMYTKKIREFHAMASHKLLQSGLLRFYWLVLNGDVVAALYGFHHNKIFYFYLSGFHPEYAPYGVGTLLFYEAITKSIQEGFTHFDFMRGKEAYKYRLGAKDTINYRLIFSQNAKLFKAYVSLHKRLFHGVEAVKSYIHTRGKNNGKHS